MRSVRGIVLSAVLLWAIPTGAYADGAIAVGLPANAAKGGVATGQAWNYPSPEAAGVRALQECLGNPGASAETRRQCKVVQTFKDECFAIAFDEKAGTSSGVGWAVAPTQAAADLSAVQKCKATARRDRQQLCEVKVARCEGNAAAPATAVDDPGDCRKQSGDVATEACNRVINSGKYPEATLASAYVNRGHHFYGRKDYDRALSDFTMAIRLNAGPDVLVAYGNRANIHYTKERHELALADYSQAISLDPNYTAAYTGRGQTHEKLGRKEEAIADYKKALSVPPKFGDGKWAHDRARDRLKVLGVGQ